MASGQSDVIFNEDVNLIRDMALKYARFVPYRYFFREWVKKNRGNKKLKIGFKPCPVWPRGGRADGQIVGGRCCGGEQICPSERIPAGDNVEG